MLFGVLGGFLVWSAFRPVLRRAAIGAGLISMVSIIAIAVTSGGYNALLQRIVWVDAALSVGLVLALVLEAAAARRCQPSRDRSEPARVLGDVEEARALGGPADR